MTLYELILRSSLEARFQSFSRRIADFSGTAIAFTSAFLIIVVWAITGPLFHYSDAWQLLINTGTTIVTFLMVFLIQNAQNEDTRELNAKLDALLQELRAEGKVACRPNPDPNNPEQLVMPPEKCTEVLRAAED